MGCRNDPLLDAFLFETKQVLEKAELILLECENTRSLDGEAINEIFRIMHTIKGSSAMMEFGSISETAHAVEDLFFYIREHRPVPDFNKIADIILSVIDYIKSAIEKIEKGEAWNEPCDEIKSAIFGYLSELKTGSAAGPASNKGEPAAPFSPESSEARPERPEEDIPPALPEPWEADLAVWIKFDDDCGMESIRAFTARKQLEEIVSVLETNPSDLEHFEEASEWISRNGFELFIRTSSDPANIEKFVRERTVYLKDCKVDTLIRNTEPGTVVRASAERFNSVETTETQAPDGDAAGKKNSGTEAKELTKSGKPDPESYARVEAPKEGTRAKVAAKQSFISVNVNKLDKLMDIVGELVISEVMVTRNPEITRLKIRSFMKSSNQLKKITAELQDIVMSIRMVPIGATFYSMQRIVRDMSKKLGKDVTLLISGEETEVDKNIIELVSDPLMHLIRNSIDHGIEDQETRIRLGKPAAGRIFLDARNEGGDVWITLRDDGKGLNREAILAKARESGLLEEDGKELTDKEVWNFVLRPGFSTKAAVSEFSGRGVGMDVVMKNIEKIGGRLNIESKTGEGAVFAVRIPLTLAIIDGMEIAVGRSRYTIPITLVKEAIRPKDCNIITDTEGQEAILLRGECIEIMRLHREFRIEPEVAKLEDGILILVQNESHTYGIFADRLIGEHQVVVKPVPKYMGKIDGVSGCSILGDGNISLILDVAGLMDRKRKNENRRDGDG